MLFALRLSAAVRSLHTSAARPAAMAKNVYAVATGRRRGLFRTWEECQKQVRLRRRQRPACTLLLSMPLLPCLNSPHPYAQVTGYPKAVFKGFKTEEEARQFLRQHGIEVADGAGGAPAAAAAAAVPGPPALDAAAAQPRKRRTETAGGSSSAKQRAIAAPAPRAAAGGAAAASRPAAASATGRVLRLVSSSRLLVSSWLARKACLPAELLASSRRCCGAAHPPPTYAQPHVQEFDGGSKGNPGPAGFGAVLYDDASGVEVRIGVVHVLAARLYCAGCCPSVHRLLPSRAPWLSPCPPRRSRGCASTLETFRPTTRWGLVRERQSTVQSAVMHWAASWRALAPTRRRSLPCPACTGFLPVVHLLPLAG